MRTARLGQSWGILILITLCWAFALTGARGAAQNKIVLKASDITFTEVVKFLAREHGIGLVLESDVNTVIHHLDFPTPTPIEEILTSITQNVGLDFWQVGETYHIGKRRAETPVTAQPTRDPRESHAVIDPLPITPPVAARPTVTPTWGTAATSAMPTPATPAPPISVIRKIDLKFTSAREMAWMFGVPGYTLDNPQRKQVMKNRIDTVLDPRRPRVTERTGTTSSGYGSSALSSPWLNNVTGNISSTTSATDAHQFPPPLPPNPNNPVTPNNPNNPNAPVDPNNPNAAGTGLAAFKPEGITDIIGLVGLNALLVRASGKDQDEAENAIDQLEQLIKMLDQPVKQVVVEMMLVKMEVKDAMSLGVSWEFAGMPWSIVSSNGGGEGNFALRYVKGNLKAALATLITNSKAKVVNAPRVIVQNGSSASISMEDSIPFIVVSEEQDVFGRSFSVPQVEMQTFQQGFSVDQITIHPDDTITLQVTPQMDSPGASIGIPGGAGGVSGGSSMQVNTIVRVKNTETIMMGGFVSKNEAMGGTRAPLLSTLPIIGPLLFRNNSHSTNNTETLIFVTPTIMKDDTTDFGGMSPLTPLF
jgi:hypothetical protein